MHTRAGTRAAAKEAKENTRIAGNTGKPAALQQQKRALGDITNFGNAAPANISFPAKKASTSHHEASSLAAAAATKIRRTVTTKAPHASSAAARRAKASALAAAVRKEEMLDLPSATESVACAASPMSTSANDSAHHRPGKRALAKLSRALNADLDSAASVPPRCGAPLPLGVLDIDGDDVDNHLSESRFAVEIHRNLSKREARFMARWDYMEFQEDITVKMRAILIDWLVDVHLKFRLQSETLHLTVNIIDRFLEVAAVQRRKLQLVGVTAMLIASKYQEIYAPETDDFVFISDKAYTKEEILKMEAVMLNTLDFSVTVPSSLTFLQRSLKAASIVEHACNPSAQPGASRAAGHLALYCVELALQDAQMLQFRPSERAASAVLLASKLVHGEARWCSTMEFHSGNWDACALSECERHMRRLLECEQDPHNSNKLSAIKRKFAAARYLEISTLASTLDLAEDACSMDVCTGRE